MPLRKPFLILQLRPEDVTADSEYEALLKYGHLHADETHRIRIERTGIPPLDPHDYAAIIVGGSPFDISTPASEKTPIQRQIEADFMRLFDTVVVEDLPFLGACSGNGLLGNYLGAPITRRYGEPVSAVDVALTEEGTRDPLLADFPARIRVLLGHKEACDTLPAQACLLIRGERCPVQMFRVGQNVYATQFHPEGDPQGFKVRIEAYKHHGYFPAETADRLIDTLAEEHTPHAQQILHRFVERYRSA